MGRITLHVGAGKCGSTAIQSLLTRHPRLPGAGGEVTYVVLTNEGGVEVGDAIAPRPGGGARKSARFATLDALPDRTVDAIRKRLSAVPHAVLSCEGWLNSPRPARSFLGRLGLEVEVVAWVRPQIEYMNSAWWQWDAWDDPAEKAWLAARLPRSLWASRLGAFAEIPQVRSLTPRLLPGDVIPDALAVLGVRPDAVPPVPRANESLPGALLRFFQGHPDIRLDRHREVSWTLPDLLRGRDLGPVPWVIGPALAERIVEKARPDNERLLDMLDPASATAMRADARWWDPAAYAGRRPEPFRLDVAEQAAALDALAVALLGVALDASPLPPDPGAPAPAGRDRRADRVR